jgi:hypothetical protein
VDLIGKLLRIRCDFLRLVHKKDDNDDDNPDETAESSSEEVISDKIMAKNEEGEKKAESKTHIFFVNKRKLSIRKIHIRVKKSIHITTNQCQNNDDFVEGRVVEKHNENRDDEVCEKPINQETKRQLCELVIIFGLRLFREMVLM